MNKQEVRKIYDQVRKGRPHTGSPRTPEQMIFEYIRARRGIQEMAVLKPKPDSDTDLDGMLEYLHDLARVKAHHLTEVMALTFETVHTSQTKELRDLCMSRHKAKLEVPKRSAKDFWTFVTDRRSYLEKLAGSVLIAAAGTDDFKGVSLEDLL